MTSPATRFRDPAAPQGQDLARHPQPTFSVPRHAALHYTPLRTCGKSRPRARKERADMDRIAVSGLKIARCLIDFVEKEAIPGTGVEAAAFWSGFAAILADLGPRCAALLATRDRLQSAIDAWHTARRGKQFDQHEYLGF